MYKYVYFMYSVNMAIERDVSVESRDALNSGFRLFGRIRIVL